MLVCILAYLCVNWCMWAGYHQRPEESIGSPSIWVKGLIEVSSLVHVQGTELGSSARVVPTLSLLIHLPTPLRSLLPCFSFCSPSLLLKDQGVETCWRLQSNTSKGTWALPPLMAVSVSDRFLLGFCMNGKTKLHDNDELSMMRDRGPLSPVMIWRWLCLWNQVFHTSSLVW